MSDTPALPTAGIEEILDWSRTAAALLHQAYCGAHIRFDECRADQCVEAVALLWPDPDAEQAIAS